MPRYVSILCGVFPLSSKRARFFALSAEVLSELTMGKVDSWEPKTPASLCWHFIAEVLCLEAALHFSNGNNAYIHLHSS